MHWINELVPFITGLGLGAILSAMIKRNLTKKACI
jgi:hypothetical protein